MKEWKKKKKKRKKESRHEFCMFQVKFSHYKLSDLMFGLTSSYDSDLSMEMVSDFGQCYDLEQL